jgi:hypothetical protein
MRSLRFAPKQKTPADENSSASVAYRRQIDAFNAKGREP